MQRALIKILRSYALQLRLILSGKLTPAAAARRKNRQYNYPAPPDINIASLRDANLYTRSLSALRRVSAVSVAPAGVESYLPRSLRKSKA